MAGFFGIGAIGASLMLFTGIALGHLGSGAHLLLVLAGSVLAVSLHCLVFGIFTGAGKDTRELVQDLNLDRDWALKTKAFRKTNFPPALYSIFFLMFAIFAGGALSTRMTPIFHWVHGILAWGAVLYNVKTFWLEYASIRENSRILKQVNREAAKAASGVQWKQVIPNIDLEPVSPVEWGTHVFALGKFLCFLGYNLFLPYIYTRYIMGMIKMPFWPYLTAAVVLVLSGYYLRMKYQSFQPQQSAQ